MIDTWVRLIESGAKGFDDCPAELQEAVKARLIEDGYWE
jgi:hypothetical protein